MRVFRDALVALLPSLARAKIAWRELDAYDQWDRISEVLFEEIVCGTIRFALSEPDLSIPRYDLTYSDYSSFSVISVRQEGIGRENQPLVFWRFDPNEDTFARVECRSFDDAGRVVVIDVSSAQFGLLHRQRDGSLVEVTDLAVTL